MDYEEDEKNWVPLVLVILFVLGIAGGGIYFLLFGAKKKEPQLTDTKSTSTEVATTSTKPQPNSNQTIEETPSEILETTGVKVKAVAPEDAALQIAKIFESGDLERASRALGGEASGASLEALQRLQALNNNNGFKLKQVREVGELEIGRRKRFAIEWEGSAEPLFLDLTRGDDKNWTIEEVRLPKEAMVAEGTTAPSEPANGAKPANLNQEDSLAVSDNFLQATLSQNFAKAKSFANTEMVSDAKIAAMCILFEEGKYRLNPAKPLRTMFNRETTAGFLANVLTSEVDKPAQFGVNLMRESAEDEWKVTEINLDSLLADYATRVAGGDVYYTPLVPNPQGGETLVIFFDFDEKSLAPRTERQLSIVADVLRTNPNRNLTLFGHADALGSDEYNKSLSQKRAATVRDFLIQKGVGRSQIDLVAEGESHPRRPNETASGEDDPGGRRANRRTEIYLDFGNQ